MKRIIMLVLLAMVIPMTANAGGYIGVGFGVAKWDTEIEEGTAEIDDTDSSVRFFGGFQANENFGIELGIVNLGEASLTGGRYDTFYMNGEGYYFPYGGTISVDADTKYIAGVFRFPTARKKVIPFVSLGLHAWDAELTATMNRLGSATSSDDGTDIMFRTGVEFSLSPQFSIVGDYAYYKMDDEDNLLNYIGVLGASAILRF